VPLAVGYGKGEMFIGSDALALAPLTRRITYFEASDWAVVDDAGALLFDTADRPVEREIRLTSVPGAATGKGSYRHFMEKELHEHPVVLGDTLTQYLDPITRRLTLPPLPFDPAAVPRLTITACGSALLTGLVGRYWIERLARIPVDADVASESRYRQPSLPEGGAVLLVSQLGETADTITARRLLRANGPKVVLVVNVPESSMARESDGAELTVAGREIGVASTKAFTAQLLVRACLAIGFGRARGTISTGDEAKLTASLLEVLANAGQVLEREAEIQAIAAEVAKARDVTVSGPRHAVPDRDRRGAEVQGDQLHPRRGLCRRRDEAWPLRTNRFGYVGDLAAPVRADVQGDGVKPAGSRGARWPHHGLHRRSRCLEAAPLCGARRGAAERRHVFRTYTAGHSCTVARLSRRGSEGRRRGRAAQPSQERHGGMSTGPLNRNI
jgi:hypothetical protein